MRPNRQGLRLTFLLSFSTISAGVPFDAPDHTRCWPHSLVQIRSQPERQSDHPSVWPWLVLLGFAVRIPADRPALRVVRGPGCTLAMRLGAQLLHGSARASARFRGAASNCSRRARSAGTGTLYRPRRRHLRVELPLYQGAPTLPGRPEQRCAACHDPQRQGGDADARPAHSGSADRIR